MVGKGEISIISASIDGGEDGFFEKIFIPLSARV
jgi:hypothetical protein